MEQVLEAAQTKFLEVYGKAALATAKRAYRAVFSGTDDVTFDSLEEKLRIALVWFNDILQTIDYERRVGIGGGVGGGGGDGDDELAALLRGRGLQQYAQQLRDLVDAPADLLELEEQQITTCA